jgi:hypothetical protein
VAALILAGAGTAIAIGGGIYYGVARADLSDALDQCPHHVCTTQAQRDDANSIRTRVNVAGGITVGGVVVAGAGLAWYFLFPNLGRGTTAAFTPAAAPGFAGLSYSGRF